MKHPCEPTKNERLEDTETRSHVEGLDSIVRSDGAENRRTEPAARPD
jgi:hypothetical protein